MLQPQYRRVEDIAVETVVADLGDDLFVERYAFKAWLRQQRVGPVFIRLVEFDLAFFFET
jgi:hypothetical protein